MADSPLIYTGIGSRESPKDIRFKMKTIGTMLAVEGYCLRSGGAPGADFSFEEGCDSENGKKEIYLPWAGFNDNMSPLFHPSNDAFDMASMIHPKFKTLKYSQQLLIARNMHQIFGASLNKPTDFVICWTPDGCESHETYSKDTGGTGSAIKAASLAGIPIFNLKNTNTPQRWFQYMQHLTTIKIRKDNVYKSQICN